MKKLILILTLFGLCAAAEAQDTLRVQASGDRFVPDSAAVRVGDAIVWEADPVIHGVAEIRGRFHLYSTGDSAATWVPRRPGTYRYVCPSHVTQGMSGIITVLPDTSD